MRKLCLLLLILASCGSVCAAHDSADEQHDQPVRAAIEMSLELLTKASLGSSENRKCFTCHGQALPVMAFAEAKLRGFTIDEDNVKRQVEHTAAHLKRGRKDYLQGKGQGGRVDMAGYALWTLEAGAREPDEVSAAVASYIAEADKAKGFWKHTSNRPPSEASDFTTTYLALRALAAFGTDDQQQLISERNESAADWLRTAEPKDTEDRAFQIRAMDYVGIDSELQTKHAEALLTQQRHDGGWAQTPEMESDAYATGIALVALARTQHIEPTSGPYRRGIKYLLETQHDDGSWHVVSRSKPFQKHFESGFPHGKDQFISTSATGWATIALLLTIPTDSNTTE